MRWEEGGMFFSRGNVFLGEGGAWGSVGMTYRKGGVCF